MFGNLAFNMDLLAQNKVLDFDGAAYLMGTQPRYVGNPQGQTAPFLMNPDNPSEGKISLPTQPEQDEFQNQSKENKDNIVKLPTWKKVAFAALAIGALSYGAYKGKAIFQWIKDKIHPPKISKT